MPRATIRAMSDTSYLKDESSQLSEMFSGRSKNNPKKLLRLIIGLEISYGLFGLK